MAVKITAYHIEAWVARHFKFKRRSHGRQLAICNPFNGDGGYNMWISLYEAVSKKNGKSGFWVHDWRVGTYNISFVSFVRKYKNLSRFEALKDITGGSNADLRGMLQHSRLLGEAEQQVEEIEQEVTLPKFSLPFTDETYPKVRQASLNYLASRMVSYEDACKYYIHYTPTTIVFPYIEYGTMVFWQEREIIDKRFNFPNEEKTGLKKTDYLYNFDNVEPHDWCGIVESLFNCISIGDQCTASGGAVIGGRQKLKLRAIDPEVIVLGPDNDKAGIESLRKNYFELKDEFKVAYSLPPDGIKDWNDLEKRDGKGSAREYMENHIYKLSMPVIMRLLSKFKA